MDLEVIISRNRSIMPFLMHCMNLLCQRHPEFKNSDKVEAFFTQFIKNETASLEEMIIKTAKEYLSE
ncbi:MAG: hypothetical protein EAX96_10560 [Candidatus Lokiarchaeota archaeon]|nr:hypothetical protein [Candidatus Lokiarchaeota archaeon]